MNPIEQNLQKLSAALRILDKRGAQLQSVVQQQAAMLAELQTRPRTITEEIDQIPGRRIETVLSGEVVFDATDEGKRGNPILIQLSAVASDLDLPAAESGRRYGHHRHFVRAPGRRLAAQLPERASRPAALAARQRHPVRGADAVVAQCGDCVLPDVQQTDVGQHDAPDSGHAARRSDRL